MDAMSSPSWHERLSALDAAFLYMEDRNAHMHVGGLCVFDGPPPSHGELLQHVESRLAAVPRYRQRLAFVPLGQGRPVWVDDAQFDLEYHVRRTALPAPGGESELRRLTSRLLSQRLDRDKPLWELWCVEGLEEGRFALVSKTHHCMIDGISGVDIATVLLDRTRATGSQVLTAPWRPRPAPSGRELLLDSVRHQLTHPLEVARDALRGSAQARRQLGEIVLGALPMLKLAGMGRAPASSLNQPIGPHRRFETVRLDLGRVRRVKGALGGTVNDVILAVVAGALRSLLQRRGEPVDPANVPDLRLIEIELAPASPQADISGDIVAALAAGGVTAEVIEAPDEASGGGLAPKVRNFAFWGAVVFAAMMAVIAWLAARGLAARRREMVTVMCDLGATRGQTAGRIADRSDAALLSGVSPSLARPGVRMRRPSTARTTSPSTPPTCGTSSPPAWPPAPACASSSARRRTPTTPRPSPTTSPTRSASARSPSPSSTPTMPSSTSSRPMPS